MNRWPGLFPRAYEQSSAGLVLAEQELVRRTELHTAYASQPGTTAIWQGYVDDKAQDVTEQRAVVERLRAVVRGQLQAKADAAAARI